MLSYQFNLKAEVISNGPTKCIMLDLAKALKTTKWMKTRITPTPINSSPSIEKRINTMLEAVETVKKVKIILCKSSLTSLYID